jgi:hypothetical protein
MPWSPTRRVRGPVRSACESRLARPAAA